MINQSSLQKTVLGTLNKAKPGTVNFAPSIQTDFGGRPRTRVVPDRKAPGVAATGFPRLTPLPGQKRTSTYVPPPPKPSTVNRGQQMAQERLYKERRIANPIGNFVVPARRPLGDVLGS